MLETVHKSLTRILGNSLIASQVQTIIAIVAGLLEGEEAGIAKIGRKIHGAGKEKSKMNRVYRFVSNPRVEVGRICEAMVRALSLKGKVVVATDWTEIGPLSVLVSAVVTKGRAIPIFWTIIDTAATRKKAVEVEHMRELSQILAGVRAIHVLDRGFDDGAFLNEIGKFCKYDVRVSKGFCHRRPDETEFKNIDNFPIKRGRRHDLGEVEYTKSHRTRCRIVVFHDHQQKEPWILATNCYGESRAAIVEYYARRFRVEESFKDLKDLRNGFGLHGYRMEKCDHLSRLLAVLALGYLLVSACGHYGEEVDHHRVLQINTRRERELATWRVGLDLLKKRRVVVAQILARLSLLAEYMDDPRGALLAAEEAEPQHVAA